MSRETEIAIEAAVSGELNPRYDAVCKELFMNKEIIAPVLKEVVPEYRDCTVEDVIACIDASSIVSDPVDDVSAAVDSSGVKIYGMPTEMSSVTEKLIRYDARFRALNPRLTTETIRFYLHIDLEVQNDYTPGYPVTKRAVYYAAREISSQLGILTEQTDYNSIQKVYSIWICNENIPKDIQNTVSSYSFTKSDIIGTTDEPDADYDLMTVILIRRGNDQGKADIFDYLSGVFSSNKDKISQYVDIGRNERIGEVLHSMSGLGLSIAKDNYEKGQQYGMQQGLQQGMQQGLQQGMQQGLQQGMQQGLQQGMQQGLCQGQQEGQEVALSLMQKLFEAGRLDDAKRVTSDKEFLNQLLKEFALI